MRSRLVARPGGLSLGLLLVTLVVGQGARASDDPLFDQQWSLPQLGVPVAWGFSTGSSVKIGIVDTGIDADHPDLRSKIDAMADCVGGPCREGSARDGHGHGTSVAGIAAAATGNGKGIAGVAPDARLVVARAVDDRGNGSVEDISNGIRWVVDRGATVVNLSLGDPNFLVTSVLGTPLRPAVEYAWSRGAIPVLASGNENVGLLGLGSSNYGDLNAIIVGATDRSGNPASYSSPLGNARWGLVAPGGSGNGPGDDILSTFPPSRYAWNAGTSMAAPHVSATLALLLSQGLSREAAIDRMLSTADPVGCGGGCRGRLNVAAAVGTRTATVPDTAPASTNAPVTTARPTGTSPSTTATTPATNTVPTNTVPTNTVPTNTAPTNAVTTTTVPSAAVVRGPSGAVIPALEPRGPTSATVPNPILAVGPTSQTDRSLDPLTVATAIGLVLAVGGGLGVVGFQRFTDGE